MAKLQLQLQAMQDSMRLQQAKSDDAHRTQMIGLSRQMTQSLAAVIDTLRLMGETLRTFKGDVTIWSHSVNEQLISLSEQAGISQRRLQELKANVEAGEARMNAAPPATAPGAPGAPGAPATGAGMPGPTQLFQVAKQQLYGAPASARAAFEDFLAQYPNHELAGEAQMWIADSYYQEGNKGAADSAYAIVPQKYPTANYAASRSLYKRAMIKKEAGRNTEAIALFQQILDKYPRENEAQLAGDMIRALKKP